MRNVRGLSATARARSSLADCGITGSLAVTRIRTGRPDAGDARRGVGARQKLRHGRAEPGKRRDQPVEEAFEARVAFRRAADGLRPRAQVGAKSLSERDRQARVEKKELPVQMRQHAGKSRRRADGHGAGAEDLRGVRLAHRVEDARSPHAEADEADRVPRILLRQPAAPGDEVGPFLDAQSRQPLPVQETSVPAHVGNDDAETLAPQELARHLNVLRVLAVEDAVHDEDDRARRLGRRRDQRDEGRASGAHLGAPELEPGRRRALARGRELLVLSFSRGIRHAQRAREGALRAPVDRDRGDASPEGRRIRRRARRDRGLGQPVQRATPENRRCGGEKEAARVARAHRRTFYPTPRTVGILTNARFSQPAVSCTSSSSACPRPSRRSPCRAAASASPPPSPR